MRLARDFASSKVTWTGLGTIVYAVIRWRTGQMPLDEMALAIFAALGVIFGRDTIAKGTETVAAVVAEKGGPL